LVALWLHPARRKALQQEGVGLAKQDLDAIWTPRLGEKGVEELRHLRRTGFIGMAMLPVVAGAGLLIGTSTLGNVLGAALAAVVAWRLLVFFGAMRRLAAALSEWYGVKIGGGQLPPMNPNRFDAWAKKRGLHRRDEEADGKVPLAGRSE
jgi:hypothetical protein